MRLNKSIEISAPQQLVWDYLADPTHYLHFMSGITRWEPASDRREGLGARYRMLIRVGAAEVGGPDRVRRVAARDRHGVDLRDRGRPARAVARAQGRR